MTERSDFETLKLLYDNAVEHRKQLLRTLAKTMRDISNDFSRVAADITLMEASGDLSVVPSIGKSTADFATIPGLYSAIAEAKVTIQNIEHLTHGRVKNATAKAPVSNVTQLPRKPLSPTQAAGSSSPTGKNQGADNPGRERQRQRKKSQNDQ